MPKSRQPTSRLVQCHLHGLSYDPDTASGCVVCRRGPSHPAFAAPVSPPAQNRLLTIALATAFGVVLGLEALVFGRRSSGATLAHPEIAESRGELGAAHDGGLYYLPPRKRQVPVPILVALHPANVAPSEVLDALRTAAQRVGFALVVPTASGARFEAPSDPAEETTDSGRIGAAVEQILRTSELMVDKKHVMVLGIRDSARLALFAGSTRAVFTALAALQGGRPAGAVGPVATRAWWSCASPPRSSLGNDALNEKTSLGKVQIETHAEQPTGQLAPPAELAPLLSWWLGKPIAPYLVALPEGPCDEIPRPLTCPQQPGTSFGEVPRFGWLEGDPWLAVAFLVVAIPGLFFATTRFLDRVGAYVFLLGLLLEWFPTRGLAGSDAVAFEAIMLAAGFIFCWSGLVLAAGALLRTTGREVSTTEMARHAVAIAVGGLATLLVARAIRAADAGQQKVAATTRQGLAASRKPEWLAPESIVAALPFEGDAMAYADLDMVRGDPHRDYFASILGSWLPNRYVSLLRGVELDQPDFAPLLARARSVAVTQSKSSWGFALLGDFADTGQLPARSGLVITRDDDHHIVGSTEERRHGTGTFADTVANRRPAFALHTGWRGDLLHALPTTGDLSPPSGIELAQIFVWLAPGLNVRVEATTPDSTRLEEYMVKAMIQLRRDPLATALGWESIARFASAHGSPGQSSLNLQLTPQETNQLFDDGMAKLTTYAASH